MHLIWVIIKWALKVVITVFLFAVIVGWIASLRHTPVNNGVTFSIERATELGLDWKKAYVDTLTELKPQYIRLSAPWNEIEPKRGQFKWTNTDWLLDEAAKHGVKVTLSIGQKTPRWPECRLPEWVTTLPIEERRVALINYIKGTVERYRAHQALELWQVENEPFIRFEFGECKQFDLGVVSAEVVAVRSLDTAHKILMTDSGELGSWREAIDAGDVFGTTLYRVVNFPNGWPMYYDWVPPKLFAFAAWARGTAAADIVIAELQGEPWFTNASPTTLAAGEQVRKFSVERLKRHAWVAEHIGSPRAYWWGTEWWYFMKEKQNEPAYWNAAREIMQTN